MASLHRKLLELGLTFAILCTWAQGAGPKVHVIVLGKWTNVQWSADSANDKPITLRIRPLIVDGRVREYAIGAPHEVTDRLFVMRRAFRVNDSLPEDTAPRWKWERGGWLLVDKLTGHISVVNLPEFDPYYSPVSWYRDYVAYCGVSEDGKKIYAVVAQVSRHKPIVKKQLSGGVAENSGPDSACEIPAWQRNPVRVSFETGGANKETFEIHGHVVDVVSDVEDED